MECFLKRIRAEILNLEYPASNPSSGPLTMETENVSPHLSREVFVHTPYAEIVVPTRSTSEGQLSHLKFCLN